jgi:hypothetical protein
MKPGIVIAYKKPFNLRFGQKNCFTQLQSIIYTLPHLFCQWTFWLRAYILVLLEFEHKEWVNKQHSG